MRLLKARVQNYRSVIDTGEFEIENLKTIMVGPNEAGKTVILQALQQLNKPNGVSGFDVLRDYPRSLYNDITTKKVLPKDITVVTGYFSLEQSDIELIPSEFKDCIYKLCVNIDNQHYHSLENVAPKVLYKDIKNDFIRLQGYLKTQSNSADVIEASFKALTDKCTDETLISNDIANKLKSLLENHLHLIEEDNEKENTRYLKLIDLCSVNDKHDAVLKTLRERIPILILFNNYFRVKPSIHLEHLSHRVDKKLLDDKYYDYGNLCLLKLLGFTAKELSDLGNAKSPSSTDSSELQKYKDKLDTRTYQLNAASIKLTNEIRKVWMPNTNRPEADKLRLTADGQYLKVVVEDNLGVDIELDQRSEGFQWLVSFFVVFFAEAMDKHKNAVLLLDEPGTSLHGLKQREFRHTISRLAEKNQTIYTTHSPFLVGPDELDIVRVVEMKSREEGTKVHTTVSSSDPAGLLPLQEALGYDLAQSLFTQQKNLILEGLTDYWYIEATSQLLRAANIVNLDEKIALIFANTASKISYYATILFAHKLKVASLLDSDTAGDQAANQENLVHTLGSKNILRTKDFITVDIPKAEIEDLLRTTLINIAKSEYGIDTTPTATANPSRPIVDIFSKEIPSFSKYKLAKAYIRWSKSNDASCLTEDERKGWVKLVTKINKALE